MTTIADTIRAGAVKIAALLGRNVTVRIGTVEGDGLLGTVRTGVEMDGIGERGITASRVYLSRDIWAEQPKRGESIKVGDRDCITLEVRADPAGALWIVEYQEQRPIEGA